MNQAKLRTPLSETELAEAIKNCAREPIHLSIAIQPHGVLLVINPHDMIIQQASANIEHFFTLSTETILNQPLSVLLAKSQVENIQKIIMTGELQPIRTLRIEIALAKNNPQFDVLVHRSGEQLIIEIEPASLVADEYNITQAFYDRLRSFAVNLRKSESLQALYQIVVDEVRNISGFDRVKLYKFDNDWHGTVVAESRASHMTSYLGMHFPASDIPEQARKLYAKSYIRLIADIHYEPVPIIPNTNPQTGQLLDLSLASLRSVSPVHIQYLDNMQIKASMSISIIQNNKLWGLIACHHNQARYINHQLRMTSELIGHVFSSQLSTLEESKRAEHEQEQKLLLADIAASLSPEHSLQDAIENKGHYFCKILQASGVAFKHNQQWYYYGKTPDQPLLDDIIAWLKKQSYQQFVTHKLKDYFPLSGDDALHAAGLLALTINHEEDEYILWFRQETIQKITWAGKPEKIIEKDSAGYRLTPRGSFSTWQETLGGSSLKWPENHPVMTERLLLLMREKIELERQRQFQRKLQQDLFLSSQEIKKLKDFQDLILLNSPDLIFVKDENFRIVSANPAFLSLYPESERDQVIGSTTIEKYNKTEAEEFMNCDRQAFDQGYSERLESIMFPDGKLRTLATKKVRFVDSNGQRFILGMSRDVTDSEKLVMELERSNEELDEFAYIASHDLKEPLRGISTNAFFLHDLLGEHADEPVKQRIQRILDLAKYMETLVNDLLYFSRVGRSDLAMQKTDLNALVQKIIDTTPLLEEENVRLELANSLPTIICDKVRIGEVFRNLITNAIKYNNSQDKRIEIGSLEQLRANQPLTVFYVRDNGIGIDEKFHHEIFRIFKRLHGKLDYGGGSGAGLTFVQKIIDRHQGEIWVESEVEHGTTFYFTLAAEQLAQGDHND